jgi:peptidoglycan hydrolase-like protein with peptidoglycan-binding domain
MRVIIRNLFAALLLVSSGVCFAQNNGFSFNTPSISCSTPRNAVSAILCNVQEAARADWEVNAASWATYFSLGEAGQKRFDADQDSWRQSLDRICALPSQVGQQEQIGQAFAQTVGLRLFVNGLIIPGPQPITQGHVACLINAYRARANVLRSRLAGDALVESSLSPEQHAAIQMALADKGFLRDDQVGPGTHDGEFGPITRNAIKAFQQSLGEFPSGFLSSTQRSALMESPAERDARAARLAAEAKARQEALMETERKAAQAAADQRAQQEAERARLEAEAKARQDAAMEAQRKAAQAAAEQKAKEDEENARLQAEAEAARQWSLKVDEARTMGGEYAKAANSKWSLSETDNPMTDDKDYVVTSQQSNGKGVIAVVEGTCRKPGRVTFVATLQDAVDPKSALGLPDFDNGYIAGNKRINDDPQFPTGFLTQKFRNSILISTLTSLGADESIETTWRVLADIDTARGRIIIQIPTFDANVQKLLVACGRQFENIKNRRGLTDARRAQQ